MQKDTVIIVRTNRTDAWTLDLISRLSALPGYEIAVCADETNNPLAVADNATKISVSKDIYAALGLFVGHDAMWRCGDYCFYVTRKAFPNAKHYWIIEPDLHINENLQDFFNFFDLEKPEYDFLGVRYNKAGPQQPWYDTMERFETSIYICQYPIVRLSGKAIDFLFSERLSFTDDFRKIQQQEPKIEWPNDEVFTATRLSNANYLCADLNGFGRDYYQHATLSYLYPSSIKHLLLKPTDGLIYHPVVSGDSFRKKAEFLLTFCKANIPDHAGRKNFFTPVLGRIFVELALEVDFDHAKQFEADYLSLLEAGKTTGR